MGKDLRGKELGKGISQRKDVRYQAGITDRYHKRVCLYDANLSKLKRKMKNIQAKDELRITQDYGCPLFEEVYDAMLKMQNILI